MDKSILMQTILNILLQNNTQKDTKITFDLNSIIAGTGILLGGIFVFNNNY